MLDFPLPIITPRLLLRQPISGYVDAQEYVHAVTESIEELRPWLAWAQYCPTINQAERYICECCANWITKDNNSIGLPLWIIERAANKLVGHIVMWNIVWDIPKFELGFWIRTADAHRGFITEAVNALTRYCFLQLKARRVEIRCEIKNIRSQLVPQRLGYELDEVLHNSTKAIATGELTDTMVFSRVDLVGLPELDVKWGKDL